MDPSIQLQVTFVEYLFSHIFLYLLLFLGQSISFSADFSADSDTFSADFSNSNFLEYKNQIYIRVTTCNRFEINIHKTTSSTIHQVKLHHILTVNARIISISVMMCLGFP